MGSDDRNETFFSIEGMDIEEAGNLPWDSVRPPAVAVYEPGKPGDFRLKPVVGGMGAGGVVFSLQRIA